MLFVLLQEEMVVELQVLKEDGFTFQSISCAGLSCTLQYPQDPGSSGEESPAGEIIPGAGVGSCQCHPVCWNMGLETQNTDQSV